MIGAAIALTLFFFIPIVWGAVSTLKERRNMTAITAGEVVVNPEDFYEKCPKCKKKGIDPDQVLMHYEGGDRVQVIATCTKCDKEFTEEISVEESQGGKDAQVTNLYYQAKRPV